MSGDYKSGWGGHALLEFSASPGGRFDLRSTGSFAAGDFHKQGVEAVVGLDVVGVFAFGSYNSPYLGLGLGYSHSDVSAIHPFGHDLGVSVAAGFEWRRQAGTWFTEARLRAFGDIFYDEGLGQTILLLSVGRSLR